MLPIMTFVLGSVMSIGLVFLTQAIVGGRERVTRRQALAARLYAHRPYLVHCWKAFYTASIETDFAALDITRSTPASLMRWRQKLQRERDDEIRAVAARKELLELIAGIKLLFTENKAIRRLADTCYWNPIFEYTPYVEMEPAERAFFASPGRWLAALCDSSDAFMVRYFDPLGVLVGILQEEAKGGRLEPLIAFDMRCPRCKNADTTLIEMRPSRWSVGNAAAPSDSIRCRCLFCRREFIRVGASERSANDY